VLPAVGFSSFEQWADLSNQWIRGQANPGKASFLEGDTVPYWVGFTGLTPGQTYGIRINLNYYQKNTNAGGFAALNTYNASINPIPNNPGGSGSPPTADSTYAFSDPFTTYPHPTFFVQNADILSVTYETNVTPTSPTPVTNTDRFVDIVFECATANPEIYYGLTLSRPGQNFPSVSPPIAGAAGFTGGSLQTSIQGTPAAGTPIPTQPTGGWIGGNVGGNSGSVQLQPGVVVQGSISGLKWNDLNGNSVKDGTEPGLQGWTINLYTDSNGNGIFEPGTDALYATATTNASGNYTFSAAAGKPPVLRGTYFVEEVQQPGWTATAPTATTSPPSAGIDPTTGLPFYKVVINEIGATPSGLNFGNRQTSADLSITKTDGVTSVVPGTPNTYTIVVSNAGPSAVTS
jgi:hypothetical protein